MTKRLLYLCLFIFNLSNELLNMGLIVWAATQTNDPLKQTAWVALWAASGYILALAINSFEIFRTTHQRLLAITIILSASILFFSPTSLLGGLLIFLRSAMGQIAYAKFATLIPLITPDTEIASASKNAQLAATLGNASAILLSPLISNHFGIMGVFSSSCTLLLLTLAITYRTQTPHDKPATETNVLQTPGLFRSLDSMGLMLFITWAVYGIFFVIEIPLITARIGTNPSIISAILTLNFITNLLVAKFVPSQLLGKYSRLLFFVGCLGLTTFTFSYLRSFAITSIFFSVAALGAFNGLMNITVFMTVQKVTNSGQREARFLAYRFATEVGILLGIVVVYWVRQKHDYLNSLEKFAALIGASQTLVILVVNSGSIFFRSSHEKVN